MPLIIVCDNEQDRDFQYGGLSELTLKARVDLDAEITFLDDTQLAESRGVLAPHERVAKGLPSVAIPAHCGIGSLEALRRGVRDSESLPEGTPFRPRTLNDGNRKAMSFVHAALARVDYGLCSGEAPNTDRQVGWLLYVKSSLTGDESADILQYHASHPDFPHQSTADQFFDEAQWESYRALGEHIAQTLFLERPELADWVRREAAAPT